MGCGRSRFQMGDETVLAFSEGDDDVSCLCTFPHNDSRKLAPSRVRSLAYLGAAVALWNQDHDSIATRDWNTLPGCLPDWIRVEIDKLLPVEED